MELLITSRVVSNLMVHMFFFFFVFCFFLQILRLLVFSLTLFMELLITSRVVSNLMVHMFCFFFFFFFFCFVFFFVFLFFEDSCVLTVCDFAFPAYMYPRQTNWWGGNKDKLIEGY